MLTAERLRELVSYDPETGIMRRRVATRGAPAGNALCSVTHRGFLQGKLEDRNYMVHRLAWLYVFGAFPEGQLAHINGDKTDNRICNLDVVAPWDHHELTAAKLRELVDYDPETGVMRWRVSRRRVKIGAIVGSKNKNGYLFAHIGAESHPVHRLAWLHAYGQWPALQIDHINGDRSDNRLCNLREATQHEQNGNMALHGRNTSGFRGVSWDRRSRRWRSYINIAGKQKHLGNFRNKTDAAGAYRLAAEKYFGEFAVHISRSSVTRNRPTQTGDSSNDPLQQRQG